MSRPPDDDAGPGALDGAGQVPVQGLRDPARLAAVRHVIGQTAVGDRLDRLVTLAARLTGAGHAQISLIGDEQQVVAAGHGLGVDVPHTSPAKDSLCTVTVAGGRALVVEDARHHPLVRDLPPVVGGAVGAYVGALLRTADGHVVGSLCAFDSQARTWSPQQVEHLHAVAELVQAELDVERPALPADLGLRASLAAGAAELGSFLVEFPTDDAGGGDVLQWDEQMLALHGLTATTFDGTAAAFRAVCHPSDVERVLSAFEHARATLGDLLCEYRALLPDGSRRWVRVRGRVMPDLLGRASCLVGAAYDATAEIGLRDEMSRLTETMPAGLVRLDPQYRFTYVNTAAERIYARSRNELVGRGAYDVFPELAGTAIEDGFQRATATGEACTVEASFAPLSATFEVHVWPDEAGLTLFFHDVTARRRTQDALDQVSDRLAVLAAAGSRLSASLQPAQVLDVLCDLLVPDLGCAVTVAVTHPVAELLGIATGPEPERLSVVRVRHRDPGTEAELRALLETMELRTDAGSGVGRAVRTREVESLDRVPDEVLRARASSEVEYQRMARLNTGPQMTLPLVTPSGVVGAITVAGSGGRPLDEVLLTDLAGRAAVAFENALTFVRQHQAATVLQRALLPRTAIGVPGVRVATRYLPAAETALAGGDFFKTVAVDGTLVCALGDVMGHGTASAARAGQLHGLVAALALQHCGPAELLTRLSHGVEQMMELELATLLVASYDPATRLLTAATAGHPPPLIARSDADAHYLDLPAGPPIGVAAATHEEVTVLLPRGGTAVLYSDGIVERRCESLTAGLERLRTAMTGVRLAPDDVAEHLLRRSGVLDGSDDDVALLVLDHP